MGEGQLYFNKVFLKKNHGNVICEVSILICIFSYSSWFPINPPKYNYMENKSVYFQVEGEKIDIKFFTSKLKYFQTENI